MYHKTWTLNHYFASRAIYFSSGLLWYCKEVAIFGQKRNACIRIDRMPPIWFILNLTLVCFKVIDLPKPENPQNKKYFREQHHSFPHQLVLIGWYVLMHPVWHSTARRNDEVIPRCLTSGLLPQLSNFILIGCYLESLDFGRVGVH